MNLSDIYSQLIEVLAENSEAAPQYWSIAELKRYINDGNRELTRQGGFSKFLLPLQQAELGAYYAPDDMLELKQIYYKGKALDHKDVDFLDAYYGGTAHQQIRSGDGSTFGCNWRNTTGDPIHWFYENGKVKLYPKPEISSPTTYAVTTDETFAQGKITGTVSAGDAVVPLTGAIPLEQDKVNFYYGGVYQNKDQWSITNSGLITLTGWTFPADNDYEIKYDSYVISTTRTFSVGTVRSTIDGNVSTGDTSLTLSGYIPLDQNRVNLFIGGVYQNKDQWSITNASLISFTGWTATFDNDYEIVYIPDAVTLSTIQASEKYLRYISAGTSKITVPGGYTQGIGALSVSINGVTMAQSTFLEPSPNYVLLNTAVLVASSVEIQVTRTDATQTAAILYAIAPTQLVNDSDIPEITNPYFQEAIVFYAAFLSLSKEGKLTQDLQKAQIHMSKFIARLEAVVSLTVPQVDIAPQVQMPFHA